MSLFNCSIPELSAKLAGLSDLAEKINRGEIPPGPKSNEPPPALATAPEPAKRARAKKIRKPLGPFETSYATFKRGRKRQIQISRLTPFSIVYRVKGMAGEWSLPHGVALQKAQSLDAGIESGPRQGKVRRG